jgi:hypothetical protein
MQSHAALEGDDLLEHFGKHVIELAVRWMLDQGIAMPFWGGGSSRSIAAPADGSMPRLRLGSIAFGVKRSRIRSARNLWRHLRGRSERRRVKFLRPSKAHSIWVPVLP